MRSWKWLLVIAVVVALVGCGSKGGEVSGGGFKPDAPNLDEDRITPTTPLPYQTFWGYVKPGYDVEVRGGAEIVNVNSDPQDGRFCVEVPLNRDTTNHLEFYAIAPGGERSDPTKVDVVHDSSLEPEAVNVALAKVATASSSSTTECPECTPDKAVDGNESTFWENSANFMNPDAGIQPQWLLVNLGSEFYVKQVVIKWGGEKYGEKYEVWSSLLDSPPDPHNEPGLLEGEDYAYYEPLYSENHGDGTIDEIDGKYKLARWIALVLFKSNFTHPISKYSKYDVHELELWGFEPGGNVPYDEGCP